MQLFKNALQVMEFFENDTLAYLCGCLKMELFDNDESASAFPLD